MLFCDHSSQNTKADTQINFKMATYIHLRNAKPLAYDDFLEDEIPMLFDIEKRATIPQRNYQRFNLESIRESEAIEVTLQQKGHSKGSPMF